MQRAVSTICMHYLHWLDIQGEPTFKVHIFWEGHKILRNLPRKFDWHYIGQIYGGDFAKNVWPPQNI